jgi:hypothetical protein
MWFVGERQPKGRWGARGPARALCFSGRGANRPATRMQQSNLTCATRGEKRRVAATNYPGGQGITRPRAVARGRGPNAPARALAAGNAWRAAAPRGAAARPIEPRRNLPTGRAHTRACILPAKRQRPGSCPSLSHRGGAAAAGAPQVLLRGSLHQKPTTTPNTPLKAKSP